MELLVATGNKKKLEEFRRILEPLGIRVLSPGELGVALEVEETGETFAQNARLKAEAFFRHTGKPSVADDSGLCVDALGGRPGVCSARYQGEDAPYTEKMAALLAELNQVPDRERGAHFTCAIHCTLGEGAEIACQDSCRGAIGRAPSGSGGFGYDPLFCVGERSFADIPPGEKDAISHRGRALRRFAALLEEYIKAEKESL